MKIKDKIMLNNQGLIENGPINIVLFGDSISHGAINGYFDYENVYWNRLKKKLNKINDYVPVNMIDSAVEGSTASQALCRIDNWVLNHNPDLIIVCFGLNDVNYPLENYLNSLKTIFNRCTEAGFKVIFMTPNMLNTYVAPDTPEQFYDYAFVTAEMQNSGKFDEYIDSAKKLAADEGITVCDCYSKWKELSKTQDTTMLLANRINHPTPEMHELFAESLYEIIMAE